MSYSKLTFEGNAENTFSIDFPLGFLSRSDVTCRVNDEVDGSDLPVYREITWITDGLVTISGAATSSDDDVVFARTVSKILLVNDYQDGSPLTEKSLDDSYKQLMMAIQEILDGRVDAAAALDPISFVNLTQVNALIAGLQEQIDALQASIDSAIADAVAALEDTIDERIAAALAGIDLQSGDRLIQHTYDEYISNSALTTQFDPNIDPENTDGTEILSCTIVTPNIGNKLLCTVQASGHPSQSGVAPCLALFIDGVFKRAVYGRSSNNTSSFPANLTLQYEMDIVTSDDIEVTVRGGLLTHSGSVAFNDDLIGGQSATLTVDEIGIGSGSGGGIIIPPNSGDSFILDITLQGDANNFTHGAIYTFTNTVAFPYTPTLFENSTIIADSYESHTRAFCLAADTIPVWSNDGLGTFPSGGSLGSSWGGTGDTTGDIVYNVGDGSFGTAHIVGDTLVFYPGDKLYYTFINDGGASGDTLADVHIHLEGEYV